MKDLFVPYEIAVKCKEAGYNEHDLAYYRLSLEEEKEPFEKTELMFFMERYDNHNFRLELHKSAGADAICTAPLFQQVIDWLYKEHKITAVYDPSDNINFRIKELNGAINRILKPSIN